MQPLQERGVITGSAVVANSGCGSIPAVRPPPEPPALPAASDDAAAPPAAAAAPAAAASAAPEPVELRGGDKGEVEAVSTDGVIIWFAGVGRVKIALADAIRATKTLVVTRVGPLVVKRVRLVDARASRVLLIRRAIARAGLALQHAGDMTYVVADRSELALELQTTPVKQLVATRDLTDFGEAPLRLAPQTAIVRDVASADSKRPRMSPPLPPAERARVKDLGAVQLELLPDQTKTATGDIQCAFWLLEQAVHTAKPEKANMRRASMLVDIILSVREGTGAPAVESVTVDAPVYEQCKTIRKGDIVCAAQEREGGEGADVRVKRPKIETSFSTKKR